MFHDVSSNEICEFDHSYQAVAFLIFPIASYIEVADECKKLVRDFASSYFSSN
jgi:hypothetical protein